MQHSAKVVSLIMSDRSDQLGTMLFNLVSVSALLAVSTHSMPRGGGYHLAVANSRVFGCVADVLEISRVLSPYTVFG